MNSNQIKCFLSVGKTLNFSQSARDLYLSQSTISKNITNLEKELGVKLFDRSHQAVHFTKKGEVFYHKMGQISGETEDAVNELRQKEDTEGPLIYMGYMDIPFEDVYLPVALELINRRSKIRVRMRLVGPNSSLNFSDLLRSKTLDFMIYQQDYFAGQEDISFTPLMQRGLSVLVNSTDHLYLKKQVDFKDLKNKNIWLWNTKKQLPTLRLLIDNLKSSGVTCSFTNVTDIMAIQTYVAAGDGIGIVPAVEYDKLDTNLRYIPLRTHVKNIYGLACLKSSEYKPYYRIVVKAFRQAIQIAEAKW